MAAIGSKEALSFSSSSSSTSHCRPYRVFLSFRGVDTRKTFTDHLYTALEGVGLHTFRDNDEIVRGKNIGSELKKAINGSWCSIIVFSKNYASSRWCLDELALIMNRAKASSKYVVLPVFYHVDPSHVRNQTGNFEEAFATYENGFVEDSTGFASTEHEWLERVKCWRNALTEAANLGGMNLDNEVDGYESKFIQKIIRVIQDKVKYKILSLPSYLIGIDYRIQEINSWLQDGSMDVGILNICGMGGIGKTTTARHAFNLNHDKFDCRCFLSNIRDVFEKPDGVISLQRQLVLDITNDINVEIRSIDEGINKIREATWSKRVLLVLDDVDEEDQLQTIFGYQIRDFFSAGSKIMITTRHLTRRAHDPGYKIHMIQKMDDSEALELFSWHAFGHEHPTEDFVELSERVINQCEGLPLALQVLGSSLLGRCRSVWESELEKLQAIPNNTILKKLKVSYDALQDEHDRDLFLEISCFFVGEDKDHMITILNQCDFHTRVGVENLMDRCLLLVDKFNKLVMHQMLREMGREISCQEKPNDPGKRRRLWRHKDSFKVMEENTGTETIEALVLDMRWQNEYSEFLHRNYAKRHLFQESKEQSKHHGLNFLSRTMLKYASNKSSEPILNTKAFRRMRKLRMLHINYLDKLKGSYKEISKMVKWLRWDGCPLKALPSDFILEGAVAIEMRHSALRSGWAGRKVFGCLKILDLSYNHDITRIRDFSRFPYLERLILKNCTSLIEVDESIGNLERSLIFLNLECCTSLRVLPRNILMLHVLETLIISGCTNLEELPANMNQTMKMLKRFDANGIIIKNHLEDSFGLTSTSLDVDSISWSHAVMQPIRPSSKQRKTPSLSWASLPSSLVKLSLWGCNLTDDAFRKHFGNLPSLRHLNLGGNPIHFLPECIKGLKGLEEICFSKCTRLQSLVGLPNVDTLYLYDCHEINKTTFQSCLGHPITTIGGCSRLIHRNPFIKLLSTASIGNELLKLLSLKELDSMGSSGNKLYHNSGATTLKKRSIQGGQAVCGVLFFFPGNQVPAWFSHRNAGNSLSSTVPSRIHTGIKGSNLYSVSMCFVYTINVQLGEKTYVVLSNETKTLKLIYGPTCYGYENSCHQHIVWVISNWMLGEDVLEPGDEINISLLSSLSLEVKVKEVGIHYREVGNPQKDQVHETKMLGRFREHGYTSVKSAVMDSNIGIFSDDISSHDFHLYQ